MTSLEVPRLRTRPPVEADGFFFQRNPSPQRTNGRSDARTGFKGRAKEVSMGQLIVVGIAFIGVSVAAAAFMGRRKPAYAVVVRQGKDRSRTS